MESHQNIKYLIHRFGPNETIHAVIKKYNRVDITKEQLQELVSDFNTLNSKSIPKVGTECKIPVKYRGNE